GCCWHKPLLAGRVSEMIKAPASEPTWICEGEKDTDNVAALGLVATTNPGGAAKWQPELTQWFKDKQLVYVLEDNDDAGRAHTAKIMSALGGSTSTATPRNLFDRDGRQLRIRAAVRP